MAVTSDCTLPSLTPAPYSPAPIRKYSAPFGHYPSNVTNSAHAHVHDSASLWPMPPNYNEGSCWTLCSLSGINPSPLEIRSRKISVEVTKISLRMDGRWAQEKPYIIQKTWDEWLEVRERIVQRYPETESVLPKLSKTHGFLESIFTNSRRINNPQSLNVKELNNFLCRLLTKCSKKVLNSSVVQNFFQTEEMRAGVFHVQYTDDDLPELRRVTTTANVSGRDDATSVASHLQTFRFPEPNAVQSAVPSNIYLATSHPNVASRNQAVGSECEMPTFNEKLSPHYRTKRPTDPTIVLNERVPPPGLLYHEPQATLWPGVKARTPVHPASLVKQKSSHRMRPTTALTRAAPVASPKRPNTSDPSQHDAVLKHTVSSHSKPLLRSVAPPSARRPSESRRDHSGETGAQKLTRPQLREFKSMQDIRATAGNMKHIGRSVGNGLVDSVRNNSIPGVGENPQISVQVRSPTNHWRRHRRTPSDSSSSFGSSQPSPISSVLSSPTITPSNSAIALLKSASNQRIPHQVVLRRSVDSLGPNSIGRDDVVALKLIREHEPFTTYDPHATPPYPFHAIPPHVLVPTPIYPRISQPALPKTPRPPLPKNMRRPHTSAENVKVGISNALTLKVTHPESKTNIILAIQRGICSLQQIKSKIQNKMKLAADIDLEPNWKIKLIMVDQAEISGRDDQLSDWRDNDYDDGSKLVELVNSQSQDHSIKKITLRII